MSVKHKNNLFSLTIFAVLATAIFFALILNNQLSSNTTTKTDSNSINNLNPIEIGSNKNQKSSSLLETKSENAINIIQNNNSSSQPINENILGSTNAKNSENNSPKSGFVKDETTIIFTSSEQKKAKQVIDQFENYFAQANFKRIFELFMTQIRDSKIEEDVVAKSRILPKSYIVLAIDLRNDSTVIAKIVETRADSLMIERYLELAPIGLSYKISRYFSSEDQLTYGGF